MQYDLIFELKCNGELQRTTQHTDAGDMRLLPGFSLLALPGWPVSPLGVLNVI